MHVFKSLKIKEIISRKSDLIWPSMAFKVKLHHIRCLGIYNVSIHIKSFLNKIRKIYSKIWKWPYETLCDFEYWLLIRMDF